jgi:hypothetical protein
MLPRLFTEFLNRMMSGQPMGRVRVGVAGSEFTYSFD